MLTLGWSLVLSARLMEHGHAGAWPVAPLEVASIACRARYRGRGIRRTLRHCMHGSRRGWARRGTAPTRQRQRQLHIRGSPYGCASDAALRGS